jgi:aryl-alcohol dehydrogenase-like predicted oxidoreductase
MKYRPLGWTGQLVSEVGLGTYPLGGALETSGSYWSGPATYGAVARETAVATIQAGLAGGLSFVDTAPVYGQAEVWIGEALRSRPATGDQRAAYVATKCGEHVRPRPDGPPELARDFSPGALRESVDRSRRRLGVERLDAVLLHSPGREELAADPLAVLVELRERGAIGQVGVSVASVEGGIALIEDGRADLLQVPFSLLEPEAARRLLPLAAERGVGVVVRQPLASGFLTGRIGEDHVFGRDDYRSAMPRERIALRARQARAFAWLVTEGIAASLGEAALRYVLGFPQVSSVIPGAMNEPELVRNLAVSALGPLPASARERVRAVQEELGLWR